MDALRRAANRGSIPTAPIYNSLKLESDNTERVNKAAGTISGAGNRKTFTISFWTKRTEINGVKQYLFEAGNSDADNDRFTLRFGTGNTFDIQTSATYLITDREFVDTAAWYHFVVKVDTTDGTAANRIKLYVNGVEETSFATDNRGNINQNFDFSVNNTEDHIIGNSQIEGSKYYNGYIAEWVQLDGTAAAPTSFGEFDDDSGIWKPIDVSDLTFGTNGFYLDFADAGDLGNDASGGTDFTLTNVTAADQAMDSPYNNFCTLASPQQFVPSKTASLVKEGGTTAFGGNVQGAYSTMGVRSGKWYFESTILHAGGVDTENHGFGCIAVDRLYQMNIAGEDIGADVGGWACAGNRNPRNNNAGASGGNHTSSPGINKVLGCAIDMDNGKIWWHNEGTWHSLNSTVGNPATGASPAFSNLLTATPTFVTPAAGFYQTGSVIRAMNFGGYALSQFTAVGTYADANGYGSFSYAPPSGFYALCTKNLAEFGG